MMPPLRSLKANRACDGCRRRKVKCDTAEPCANCRVSHLPCQYTVLPKKRGPKVSRLHKDATEGSSPRANRTENLRLQWESSLSLEDNQGLREEFTSPGVWGVTTSVALTAAAEPLQSTFPTRSCQGIWDGLLALISSALPSMPVLDVVNYSIDLYMQYTFPTTPIVHEPTLRKDASIFFSGTSHMGLFGTDDEDLRVTHIRAFTLITAVCASVASTMPEFLLPYRHVVAVPFLRASREMLKVYEDYDFEHPNSTSLSIRILQSTALQSTTGKSGAAWHVLGQATLLAQNLHLYSEEAIRRNNPTEGQLLRLNFWVLYSADKAAASLRSRPFVLHQVLFDEKMTLQPCGGQYTPLIDTNKPWYEKPFEERLLESFHLIPRLWSSAEKLISDMRAFETGTEDGETYKTRLTQAYLGLTGIMDDIPHWLQASNIMVSHDDGDVASFHKTSFWVQRCNIMTTIHCLRLVILQQCIDSGLCSILGLNDQPLTLSVKKVEIIHDFLQTLDDIPFLYHQVKGEPSVERIRIAGTTLLQVIQTVDNEAIKVRAHSYFTRLLNVLAKLNSKASDELSSNIT
ncbi:hypothetical protein B0O99DRAFT_581491, partial [Bisporella sp. PMI_857]